MSKRIHKLPHSVLFLFYSAAQLFWHSGCIKKKQSECWCLESWSKVKGWILVILQMTRLLCHSRSLGKSILFEISQLEMFRNAWSVQHSEVNSSQSSRVLWGILPLHSPPSPLTFWVSLSLSPLSHPSSSLSFFLSSSVHFCSVILSHVDSLFCSIASLCPWPFLILSLLCNVSCSLD